MNVCQPGQECHRNPAASRRPFAQYMLVGLLLTVGVASQLTPALAQTVTRGPYLGIGTHKGVVVRWRTDVATDSRVQYGPAPGNLGKRMDNRTVSTEHEVALTGLSADTKYFYSIGTTNVVLAGDDTDHYFRTGPAPGTHRPLRIWVIGDSGQPGQGAMNVRDAYLAYPGSNKTDVWLMLGDNAYSIGTDAQYQAAVFNMYPPLLRTTFLWPTRGNHDLLHSGANNDYYEIFSMPDSAQAGGLLSGTEAYYSFDFGKIHFVCLDSQGSDRSPTGPMMTWLAADLAATKQEWIVAYWHHPPYTKGSHDSDDVSDSGGRMRDMRENALPVLEAGGVDLVLTGHSHSYERSFLLDEHYDSSATLHDTMKVNTGDGRLSGDGAYLKPTLGPAAHEGAVYAVAGSSSKISGGALNHPVMITSLNVLGSMVLDIAWDQMDAVFIDDKGNVRDEFTIIKGITSSGVDPPVPTLTPRLDPVAPNPFSTMAQIRYSIPASGHVKLSIYDVKGRRIAQLVNTVQDAGTHTLGWNAINSKGVAVPHGVYFSVLEFGKERRARKVVLVK